MTFTATPRSIDDFAKILPVMPSGGGESAVTTDDRTKKCDADLKAAIDIYTPIQNAISSNPLLTPTTGTDGKFLSIPLASSLRAWTSIHADPTYNFPMLAALMKTLEHCKFDGDQLVHYRDLVRGYNTLLDLEEHAKSNHQIETSVRLDAESDFDVTITELYQNAVTVNGEQTFKCTPPSNQMFLSGGFLVTTAANPAYSIVQIPDGSGSSYRGIQVDHSNHLNLAATALLNYRIPLPIDNVFGLAISAGPVYRLGQSAATTNLGLYGGVSVHLWRRFFFTAGAHLSEFADFPRGYNESTIVPMGVESLNGNKRWTAKLAFGITFRTNAFSSGGSNTPQTGNSNTTPTGVAGTPAPAPAPVKPPTPATVKQVAPQAPGTPGAPPVAVPPVGGAAGGTTNPVNNGGGNQ
ncbi:MAG: hypothetical protein ABI824_16605 [Acidobacteriota bacterium]